MSPIILFLTLGLLIISVYKYYRPYLIIPGPPVWSFLKLVIRQEKTVNEVIYKVFRECASKYREEGLCVYYLLFTPLVIVHDSDSLQTIFKDPHTYVKGYTYKLLWPWMGRSTLTTNGKLWKDRRRNLIPGFHASVLQSFTPIIQRRAKELVNDLQVQRVFDAFPLFTKHVLATLCETMMGYRLTEDKLDTEYCQAVQEASRLYIERVFNAFDLYSDFIFYNRAQGKSWKHQIEIMRKFCAKIICERNKVYQAADLNEIGFDRKFKPVLDSLLTAKMKDDSITDEMLIDEVNGLIFAGHDTTAVTLTLAFYEISKRPSVWLKVKDEVSSVLGSNKDRDWTFEDMSKMVYLDAVIKEVLRFSTPLEVVRGNRKEVTLNGYRIPKGTSIICNLSGALRDPKYFPEPDTFKPERFIEESGLTTMNPTGFMPFLLSPRQCIGQHYAMLSLKLTLDELARHFSMRSVGESPKFGYCMLNKPMSPLMIEMIPDQI